jgi:hypothetical protein
MDFGGVLVTDHLAYELFRAAHREKLLFSQNLHSEDFENLSGRDPTVLRRALSLLVLFDRVVIHDLSPAFRLPDLEKDGIVEVVPSPNQTIEVVPLPTRWKMGPLANRGRPPKELLRSLSLIQQLRPFVVNRVSVAVRDLQFFSALASGIGVSRKQLVELFLDYVIAVVQGDAATLREHVFTSALPRKFLRDMTSGLFQMGDPSSGPDTVIIFAILAAQQIAEIQAVSARVGLGVATHHYGGVFRSESALSGDKLDAVSAAGGFLTLRAAFAEEGGFWPRIDTIKDALALRRDPRLQNVRAQLALLHGGLTTGDRDAIAEARREIRKARQRLQRRAGWDRALRWVAYLSVPVGVAEVLSGTPPIIGTSIAVIGAAGTAKSRKVERDNEWVLFGT